MSNLTNISSKTNVVSKQDAVITIAGNDYNVSVEILDSNAKRFHLRFAIDGEMQKVTCYIAEQSEIVTL